MARLKAVRLQGSMASRLPSILLLKEGLVSCISAIREFIR